MSSNNNNNTQKKKKSTNTAWQIKEQLLKTRNVRKTTKEMNKQLVVFFFFLCFNDRLLLGVAVSNVHLCCVLCTKLIFFKYEHLCIVCLFLFVESSSRPSYCLRSLWSTCLSLSLRLLFFFHFSCYEGALTAALQQHSEECHVGCVDVVFLVDIDE